MEKKSSMLETGIGCGLIVAGIIALILVVPAAFGIITGILEDERANAIRAKAELVIAESVAGQINAGTQAVMADTRAAHNFNVEVSDILLFIAIGALCFVCYSQNRKISELQMEIVRSYLKQEKQP